MNKKGKIYVVGIGGKKGRYKLLRLTKQWRKAI